MFNLNPMNTRIIRPEITMAQFEFKLMLFQMLQTIGQYSKVVIDDPHLHLRHFLEVSSNFKIPRIANDSIRLRLSLTDIAKSWFNSLEPNFIATLNSLAGKFLAKYFSLVKNSKLRNEITLFRQGEDGSFFYA